MLERRKLEIVHFFWQRSAAAIKFPSKERKLANKAILVFAVIDVWSPYFVIFGWLSNVILQSHWYYNHTVLDSAVEALRLEY